MTGRPSWGLGWWESKAPTQRTATNLAALKAAVARKDVGIVLITETIAGQVRDEVEARLYGMGFPLVLEIPDSHGPSPDRPAIEDVVRKAIGISI